MATAAEEFARYEAENQTLQAKLVRSAVLLEHLGQTLAVLQGTALELADELAGISADDATQRRFRAVRNQFARAALSVVPSRIQEAGPRRSRGTTEGGVTYETYIPDP